MARPGIVAYGSAFVLINGKKAARRTDLTSHGALIGEGTSRVVIGSLAAARKFDRFRCPDNLPEPHVGGAIVEGSGDVVIAGQPAARMGDGTHCHGEGFEVSDLDALPGASALANASDAAACAALWQAYQREAEALLAPGDHDHRQRNHIINGAYASLYRRNPKFTWAGLGAYASKQVGCAMDHALKVMADPTKLDAQKELAEITYENLGLGNRQLFLDVYPQHRFFEEQGWERFKQCAGEKSPPVGGAMLDAFEALARYDETGDEKYLRDHLEAVAYHEQVFILQRGIYNDPEMRFILDANEGNLDDPMGIPVDAPKDDWIRDYSGMKPADVVMTSECSDTTPGKKKTVPFNPDDPDRNLWNMEDRMTWILDEIGGYYEQHRGSREHQDDMDRLLWRGRAQGARYP